MTIRANKVLKRNIADSFYYIEGSYYIFKENDNLVCHHRENLKKL